MSDPSWLMSEVRYRAASEGCGIVELEDWSCVTVTGADRQTFLNNFCTNDIKRLEPGTNSEAFFTNVKGKILGHGFVTCREDKLVIICGPGQTSQLVEQLDRYVIREDVQVRDSGPEFGYLLVSGGAAARGFVAALAPSSTVAQALLRPLANAAAMFLDVPLQWIHWPMFDSTFCGLFEVKLSDVPRVRQQLVDRDAFQCNLATFNTLRIEAGTPLFGIDFNEDNFPQEVGRDREAISFTKGCYLGQETVARIDALGHVNQRIAGVRFNGSEIPAAGTELIHGGAVVGSVTSATFSPKLNAPLALAIVRRAHLAVGSRFESPFGACEVVALPLP